MKPRSRLLFVCALLSGLLPSPEIPAQDVYVTPGKNGPVFSDRPRPGAKELDLRPLTVIRPPAKAEPPSGPPEPEEETPWETPQEAVSYRSLAIVSPANDAGVAGDVEFLEIRLAVDPPLSRSAGHAFVVSIDDRPVEALFATTEFVIPPDFWPEGYLPSHRRARIDAAIVDAGGRVLLRAPPVNFRTLPVIVRPLPHPLPPWVFRGQKTEDRGQKSLRRSAPQGYLRR